MSYQSDDIQVIYNKLDSKPYVYEHKCVCCNVGFDSGFGSVNTQLHEDTFCLPCINNNEYLYHYQLQGVSDFNILQFKFRPI